MNLHRNYATSWNDENSMKETRYFYVPDAKTGNELPTEEAAHCLRVLRLSEGDEINLMDGCGTFYRAEITTATNKRCMYRILDEQKQPREWLGHLHLAVAPTKNIDRIEWLAEKATEIGFDELSFLECRFSERKVVKTDRINKILVSAMKQSHKSAKPILNELEDVKKFVKRTFSGQKFIAHCYDEADINGEELPCDEVEKRMGRGTPLLWDVLTPGEDALVMIGPEGDFSVEEVRLALANGFRSVSLGRSRMRTETAALVAVHLMHLRNEVL